MPLKQKDKFMFIEVERITTTGRGTENEKPLVQLELINISTIKACRHWHVGKNEPKPNYSQTILIMDNGGGQKQEINENNYMNRGDIKKPSTILIKEKYESFRDRLCTKVPVNKINATD